MGAVALCNAVYVRASLYIPQNGEMVPGLYLEVLDPETGKHGVAIVSEALLSAKPADALYAIERQTPLRTLCSQPVAVVRGFYPPHDVSKGLLVSRTGWIVEGKPCFSLPDGRFVGSLAGEKLCRDPQLADGRGWTRGTLDGWKQCPRLCQNNPVLMFGIALSLISPLLPFFENSIERAVLFQLVAEASQGKTTTLRCAGSAWGPVNGPPGTRDNCIERWLETPNNMENVAQRHSGTFIAIDEFGELAADKVKLAGYLFAGGRGKGRATREMKSRTTAEWGNLYGLSTGEVTSHERAAEGGPFGKDSTLEIGIESRIIDLVLPAGSIIRDLHGYATELTFIDALQSIMAEHHGVAGPALVGGTRGAFR